MWLILLIILFLLALTVWIIYQISKRKQVYTVDNESVQVGGKRDVMINTPYGRIVRSIVPSVDQGDCNACWAIATCQAVTDRYHLHGQIPNDQLNYYAYHDIITSRTDDNDGCNYGANLETGLSRFITDGAPLMSESRDRTFNDSYIQSDIHLPMYKVRQWRPLSVRSTYGSLDMKRTIDTMKRELESNGTIVGVINLFDSFNDFVGQGIYTPQPGESNDASMAHMVSIVGYDDRDHSWIIRNSYGSSYGYNGFLKVPQGNTKIALEEYVYAPDI